MNLQERIEMFKKIELERSKIEMESGGLSAQMSILVMEGADFGVVIVPANQMMVDEDSKDQFAKFVPEIINHLREQEMEPICLSFTSEVWIRKWGKDEPLPENFREVAEKEEAIMNSFETEFSGEIHHRLVKREGGKITVVESEGLCGTNYVGRFANFLRREPQTNSN